MLAIPIADAKLPPKARVLHRLIKSVLSELLCRWHGEITICLLLAVSGALHLEDAPHRPALPPVVARYTRQRDQRKGGHWGETYMYIPQKCKPLLSDPSFRFPFSMASTPPPRAPLCSLLFPWQLASG